MKSSWSRHRQDAPVPLEEEVFLSQTLVGPSIRQDQFWLDLT